ncbi:hypothetical protein G6M89_16015 [Natronolimnobius sp. AArcel1]|uniref:hypothetical protein n=1 Tax=Natronolimnobius sp. AArcel1 TaxID=1679093 RepID=UPI0013EB0519|nr:hypothetical protein [Natronolimnobius sp. AArcel1]NGM70489.1 hypothetical protein [Natronolimnobius sp. AArcel1]
MSWPIAGIAFVALALVIIYLRGYLIPGTPTLTQRYVPQPVLNWFGKQPAVPAEDDSTLEPNPDGNASVESILESFVVECEDVDDLCLEESFRADWREEMARLRRTDGGTARLASELGVEPARLETETTENRFAVAVDGTQVARWNSQPAYLADIAAIVVLGERDDDWATLEEAERSRTLATLRSFLEHCPACDQPLAAADESERFCCGGEQTLTLQCEACEVAVFRTTHA